MTVSDWTESLNWESTEDGFSLCRQSMAELLHGFGIKHTGLSSKNKQDVDSFYDDWFLYRIKIQGDTVFSLLKMREQEDDYRPGYADGDNPGITISFISFPMERLWAIHANVNWESQEMRMFIEAFRNVTERKGQEHDSVLQTYFSCAENKGSYLIAQAYGRKIASMSVNGMIAFPEKMHEASRRIFRGLHEINRKAGYEICDFSKQKLKIRNPNHLSHDELCCILATHTANLTVNSFAAEVKFHSDALVSTLSRLPIVGRKIWYESAIRADMQIERDKMVAIITGLSPYHRLNSRIVRNQEKIHGGQ